jgi:tRNA G10  N-methylase Trm11
MMEQLFFGISMNVEFCTKEMMITLNKSIKLNFSWFLLLNKPVQIISIHSIDNQVKNHNISQVSSFIKILKCISPSNFNLIKKNHQFKKMWEQRKKIKVKIICKIKTFRFQKRLNKLMINF